MLDTLIKGGQVIDGTGSPAFRADVGVAAGRIAVMGQSIAQEAARTIDAAGLHLAPGFIDAHTHADLTLLANRQAESGVHQGVTTVVTGNCGGSAAPLLGEAREEAQLAGGARKDITITWESMAEYLALLQAPGVAVNVVPLVGHNTVRESVVGRGYGHPTPDQQSAMERLVEEAMEQGARGLSTGLEYPPGMVAHIDEIVGLARAAAKHGGIYTSHMRNEGERVLEAVTETIEIGERAGIPVHSSHIKLAGAPNWSKLDDLMALLESPRAQGARLSCDQYPYTAGWTWLAIILPAWAQADGSQAVAARMRDPATRERLRQDRREDPAGWEAHCGTQGWDGVLMTECEGRPDVMGKTVAEIASADGAAPFDTALDLIAISEGQATCVFFDQDEAVVCALMRHPLAAVGSDSETLAPYGILSENSAHPRAYGTFPRILGRYVREEGLLTLTEAIRKMTALPARLFGLADRGVIREGAWADLVLFDAETVADMATYTDPHQYPVGIPYVLVNGVCVIDRGEHTGALPGRAL
jgi:N-acyl-D-amino-acid deacylase